MQNLIEELYEELKNSEQENRQIIQAFEENLKMITSNHLKILKTQEKQWKTSLQEMQKLWVQKMNLQQESYEALLNELLQKLENLETRLNT